MHSDPDQSSANALYGVVKVLVQAVQELSTFYCTSEHRSVDSLTFMVLPCLPRETQVAGKIPETQEGGYSSDTLEYF